MKVLRILPLVVLLLASPHLRAAELEELIGRVKEATDTLDGLATEQDTVKKLQEIGPKAIPLLLPLLRDQKQPVRELAAFTLRDMRGLTEEHLDALIGSYRRGDSSLPSVIARFGTPKAVDFLVEGFIQERQPKAPFSDAIEVLGEKAFPQLARVFERDKGWDEKLEETMLWSLGSLGPKAGRAIDPLLKIANDSAAPEEKRIRALQGLGAIGPTAARAVPDLQRLQQDKSSRIREAAENAIVWTGAEAGAPVMGRWLAVSDSHHRRILLRDIGALRERGTAAGPYVVPYLTAPDWEVRAAAIRTLGYIRYAPATEQLIALLDNPEDWRAVANAAEALGQLGVKAAPPTLTRIAQGYWYPPTREAATRALTAIHGDAAPQAKETKTKFAAEFFAYEHPTRKMETILKPEAAKIKLPVQPIQNQIPKTALNAPRRGPQCGLKMDDGYLVGRDQGEWGGELTFYPLKGKPRVVLEDNVEAIYETRGGVVAVTGVGYDQGRLCKLSKDAGGKWVAKPWRVLPGWPYFSRLLQNGSLFVSCSDGIVVISADGQMKLLTRGECF